jgi:hypothetical protein
VSPWEPHTFVHRISIEAGKEGSKDVVGKSDVVFITLLAQKIQGMTRPKVSFSFLVGLYVQ